MCAVIILWCCSLNWLDLRLKPLYFEKGNAASWGHMVKSVVWAQSALGKCVLKSKCPALEPSVFQQDVRCHPVPWELRLISWQWILMWHLAAEKYHLGNGRGTVLWPGIIHSASGWQTLSTALVFTDTKYFTDKNLIQCSVSHYVSHLSALDSGNKVQKVIRLGVNAFC